MIGFQWIPNINKYVYYTDVWTKMMSANTIDKKASEIVTLADVNTALGTKLRNFFGIEWIDASTILVSENGKYFTYSVTSKSGKELLQTPEAAENQTFDKSKQNLAFTEGNNLFLINKNKEKVAVTNNADKNIVSGQSISRNEFGISGGIFWFCSIPA